VRRNSSGKHSQEFLFDWEWGSNRPYRSSGNQTRGERHIQESVRSPSFPPSLFFLLFLFFSQPFDICRRRFLFFLSKTVRRSFFVVVAFSKRSQMKPRCRWAWLGGSARDPGVWRARGVVVGEEAADSIEVCGQQGVEDRAGTMVLERGTKSRCSRHHAREGVAGTVENATSELDSGCARGWVCRSLEEV
jgi:hypothetical protein